MAEVPRVPLGRPPAGSWLPGVAAAAVTILTLVVLKPWAPPDRGPAVTPGPTFYIAPVASERTGPRPYDPRLFGGREPDPAWELWPAGYVVQFGIAGPLKVHGQDGASPAPGATDPASSGGPPAASPRPSALETAAPPDNVVDLGPTDHLIALGINTPLHVRVERVSLWLLESGEVPQLVRLIRLPTLWESSHFIVVAPEDPRAAGQPAPWVPGTYRLDLLTTEMEVRQVLLRVRPPLG